MAIDAAQVAARQRAAQGARGEAWPALPRRGALARGQRSDHHPPSKRLRPHAHQPTLREHTHHARCCCRRCARGPTSCSATRCGSSDYASRRWGLRASPAHRGPSSRASCVAPPLAPPASSTRPSLRRQAPSGACAPRCPVSSSVPSTMPTAAARRARRALRRPRRASWGRLRSARAASGPSTRTCRARCATATSSSRAGRSDASSGAEAARGRVRG